MILGRSVRQLAEDGPISPDSARVSASSTFWRACSIGQANGWTEWAAPTGPERRRHCSADAFARSAPSAAVRVHRGGRERGRRRLHRERLERRGHAVGPPSPFSLDEAEPLLRGTVFSDRGALSSSRPLKPFFVGARGAETDSISGRGCCERRIGLEMDFLAETIRPPRDR